MMNLDDLLERYFGTTVLSEASPAMQKPVWTAFRWTLALETDRPRRFAPWSLLYMLGHAPDLDVAFKVDEDGDAARNLMDLLAASQDD